LFQLVDAFYEEVKGSWEDRFERRYGFWRGAVEDAVYAFLDCGILDHGFARVRCDECRAEFLVAFSCQRRGFCPSCAAKRGAMFGPLLAEEVLDEVGHWRHSGFSAHNAVTVVAGARAGIERLGRCLLRSPVAVERLSFEPGSRQVHYRQKGGQGLGGHVETFEPAEFLARLLQQVPEPRLHQVRYYGRYSNVSRAHRDVPGDGPERAEQGLGISSSPGAEPDAAERRRLRRLWARLIRRVYEVDPLLCHECGGSMRILAFILDRGAVRKMLAHLAAKGAGSGRAPPPAQPSSSSLAS
jgi:hypothetical protein